MKIINFFKLSTFKIDKCHLWAAMVIFAIALIVTLSNLGWKKEFLGDDAGVAHHFSSTHFRLASNMWDSYTFPGRANVIASTGLIHVGFINLLNKIGLTPIIVDRLFYFLIYFISGLGIYFLSFQICSKLFTVNKSKIVVASIAAGIFYMLNNFTMILLSFPPTSYIYSYMLLPWIFLLYLKDFHVSSLLSRKLIFSLLFLIILSGNPSNTISIIVLILFYEIFFRHENKIIQNWRNFLSTFGLILLFSSYIFLPTLGNKGNPYGAVASKDMAASIDFNSTLTSIGNLLRFRGHPAQASYVFDRFLLGNMAIISNFLLLVVAFFALLKKRLGRMEVFLFFSFLIFLFLAKSEHAPLSIVNKIIYTKVPLFEMYRASYYKFVFFCVFPFSILLSLGLIEFFEKVAKLKLGILARRLLWSIPLLALLYGAIPFFRGDVAAKLHKTAIPIEYHDLNAYFKKDKSDFSILSLPQLPSGLTLDWGNGNYYAGGANPDYFLFGRSAWSNGWFLPENPISNQLDFYKSLLGMTDVKYVVLHKDIPEKYSFEVGVKGSPRGQANFRQLDAQITADKSFKLIHENGYFKLFELNDNMHNSHFFIPKTSKISQKNIKEFVQSVVSKEEVVSAGSAVFLTLQSTGKEETLGTLKEAFSGDKTTLEYRKIGETKYRIKVKNADGQFPLVFTESFNEGWKAYIVKSGGEDAGKEQGVTQNENLPKGTTSETWFKTPLDEKSHLAANGYVNSWLIDPRKACKDNNLCRQNADGSYDIELVVEFWPQRLFYLGLSIAGVTLLVCVGFLSYIFFRRKTVKKTSQGISK